MTKCIPQNPHTLTSTTAGNTHLPGIHGNHNNTTTIGTLLRYLVNITQLLLLTIPLGTPTWNLIVVAVGVVVDKREQGEEEEEVVVVVDALLQTVVLVVQQVRNFPQTPVTVIVEREEDGVGLHCEISLVVHKLAECGENQENTLTHHGHSQQEAPLPPLMVGLICLKLLLHTSKQLPYPTLPSLTLLKLTGVHCIVIGRGGVAHVVI